MNRSSCLRDSEIDSDAALEAETERAEERAAAGQARARTRIGGGRRALAEARALDVTGRQAVGIERARRIDRDRRVPANQLVVVRAR